MRKALGADIFVAAFAKAVRPLSRITVSEWADKYRVLTSKESPEPGRWRTVRMPHLKEPMDCMSAYAGVNKVVLKFPVQMGKSEVGLNLMAYSVCTNPCPLLFVQPTLSMRDKFVAQRINTVIENCEPMSAIFDTKSQKKATDRQDIKDYPGGILIFAGANSPKSMASMPAKIVIGDEVDRCPREYRDEGDFVGVLEGRVSNYQRDGITLLISSPTLKDASVIDEQFEGGDQRYFHVPCPHCAEWLVLKFEQLHWTLVDGEVREVWYVCEHCGAEIEEHAKSKMLPQGKWVAQNPKASYRSYTINALYSPAGLGWSWLKLAQEWLKCVGVDAREKRFVNTRLALSWESKHQNLKPEKVKQRAEDFAARTVPPGVLVIVAGVDTQDDRLPLQLVGFGRGGKMWILDYVEFDGDPINVVEDFRNKKGALYEYLARPLVNAWGKEMRIQAVGWDTGGHRTDAVYTMVRSKVVSRLLAVKGASVRGKQIMAGRPSYQDVKWNGKVNKRGVALWLVGVDTAKDLILGMLDNDEDKPAEERMIRFSADLDDDYYKMLLAEKFDPEKNRYVKKSGARNEAIDTLVYAVAASRHSALRVHMKTQADWDALERLYQPENGGTSKADDADEEVKPQRKRKPHRARRKGWATSW